MKKKRERVRKIGEKAETKREEGEQQGEQGTSKGLAIENRKIT